MFSTCSKHSSQQTVKKISWIFVLFPLRTFYVLGTQNQVEVNKNHNIIKVLSSKFSAKMHQQNPHT